MKLLTITKPNKVTEILPAIKQDPSKVWDFTNAEVVTRDIENNIKASNQYYDSIGDALKELPRSLHGIAFNSSVKSFKFSSGEVIISYNTNKSKIGTNTSQNVLGAPIQQIIVAGNSKKIDLKIR